MLVHASVCEIKFFIGNYKCSVFLPETISTLEGHPFSQIIAPGSLKVIRYSSRWHAGMLGRYQVASLMIAEVNKKTNISLRDLGNIQQVAG